MFGVAMAHFHLFLAAFDLGVNLAQGALIFS